MENLVIEHKDKVKAGIGYLVVVAVLGAILVVAGDQFTWSVGTVILILALVIELGMGVSTLIGASTREILAEEGITVQNIFGSKLYSWKELSRFEIFWDYKGKRMMKKEEEENAPYILLTFTATRKKLRFDYLEVIDQYIRACYGEPHRDDWTNIGK